MFSSEPPSPERRQSVELKRPQSFIEERSRPKLYKFLSKATKRYVKTPIEIKNVPEQQQQHHHQDDIPQTSLIKPDEDEADRIQLKNDLVKLAFEGEFLLPFDYQELENAKILDVGCGPGSWCIDLATRYPNIQVFGVDNVDMFPLQHTLPINCHLSVCDVLHGLSEFPDANFDVIHIRFMILSLTTAQYQKVISDCWRLLKPGGYIEILETDLIVYSAGPLTQKMNKEMIEIAISRGYDPREQANLLNHVTLEQETEKQVKYRSIPIGVWGGRIGVLCRDDMINMLTKFKKYYFGQENQTFEKEVSIIIKEIDQYKSFSNYFFYSAQKPIYHNTIINNKFHRHKTSDSLTSVTFNPKSF